MKQTLQIVAFDNPNPPDYGGAVDLFYKLRAFSEMGISIRLHLFTYGDRRDFSVLYDLCDSVVFYKRNMAVTGLFSKKPFIVVSRNHPELLSNLAQDSSPILFEGIHCCGFLDRKALRNHFKIVRMHNIEHEYYTGLANSSQSAFRKWYFRSEARKLEKFESQLRHANLVLGITEKDAKHFEAFGKAIWIPPFAQEFPQVTKTKKHILFHGNLSVPENYNAAILLTNHVFSQLDYDVVIAGKNPVSELTEAVRDQKHIKLVANPNQETMDQLIREAHCHVFYTDQNTGVKLKLIHAIQTSGHIVLNPDMLFDDGLQNTVEVAADWNQYVEKIRLCMKTETAKNRDSIRKMFDNTENAQRILHAITSDDN